VSLTEFLEEEIKTRNTITFSFDDIDNTPVQQQTIEIIGYNLTKPIFRSNFKKGIFKGDLDISREQSQDKMKNNEPEKRSSYNTLESKEPKTFQISKSVAGEYRLQELFLSSPGNQCTQKSKNIQFEGDGENSSYCDDDEGKLIKKIELIQEDIHLFMINLRITFKNQNYYQIDITEIEQPKTINLTSKPQDVKIKLIDLGLEFNPDDNVLESLKKKMMAVAATPVAPAAAIGAGRNKCSFKRKIKKKLTQRKQCLSRKGVSLKNNLSKQPKSKTKKSNQKRKKK
jgi:hypothetical protein